MYLNKLTEEQKKLFIDLSIHASMANGIIDEKEKELIKAYCAEMEIEERYEAKYSNEDILNILPRICSRQQLRIIFLEVSALVLSDGALDTHENSFVKTIAEIAEVSDEEYQHIIDVLKELFKAYEETNTFINT